MLHLSTACGPKSLKLNLTILFFATILLLHFELLSAHVIKMHSEIIILLNTSWPQPALQSKILKSYLK